jgi:hypothetical protein
VIRAERENCCDDLVVAVQGGAYEYAHALAALEMNRGPRQALAATGGNLVQRIRRLLAQPEQRPAALAPVAAAAILTVTALTAMVWQSKPAERPAALRRGRRDSGSSTAGEVDGAGAAPARAGPQARGCA